MNEVHQNGIKNIELHAEEYNTLLTNNLKKTEELMNKFEQQLNNKIRGEDFSFAYIFASPTEAIEKYGKSEPYVKSFSPVFYQQNYNMIKDNV